MKQQLKQFAGRHWFSILMVIVVIFVILQGRSKITEINEANKIMIENRITEIKKEIGAYNDSIARQLDTIATLKEQLKNIDDEISKYKSRTWRIENAIRGIRNSVHTREFLDSLATGIQFE